MNRDYAGGILDEIIRKEMFKSMDEARSEEIRRILQDHIREVSPGFHSSYAPYITPRAYKQIRKYYDPDVEESDVLAFVDTTLFDNGRVGIMFSRNGMFIRESWTCPYYIAYKDIIIEKMKATKKKLIISMNDGSKWNMILPCDKERLGELIKHIMELYKQVGKKHESIKCDSAW